MMASTPEICTIQLWEIRETGVSRTFYGLREVRRGQVINNGGGEPVAKRFVALVYARDVVAPDRTDNIPW
jgi:hypothetical protein